MQTRPVPFIASAWGVVCALLAKALMTFVVPCGHLEREPDGAERYLRTRKVEGETEVWVDQ